MQSFVVMEEIAAMLSIAMAVFHAIHKSRFAIVWGVLSLMALFFSVFLFPTQNMTSSKHIKSVAVQSSLNVLPTKKAVVHAAKSQSFVNQMLLQVFDALKAGKPIPLQYLHLIPSVHIHKTIEVQSKTVILPVKKQISGKNSAVKVSTHHAPVSHVPKKAVTMHKQTAKNLITNKNKKIQKKLATLAMNSLVSSVLNHSTHTVRSLFAKRYAQVYKHSSAQDIYAVGYSIITVYYLHSRAKSIKIDFPSLIPTGLSKKHWENMLRQLAGLPTLSKGPAPTHVSTVNETWSNVYARVAQLTLHLDMSTNKAYVMASS